MIKRRTFLSIAAAFCSGVSVAKAAQLDDPQQPTDAPSINVLTEAQWKRVDQSIERGLQYLISQQQADGSFQTKTTGQPGVTSLCIMSFLANGYLPGSGKYGDELTKAIAYVCSHQTESGVIASAHPGGPKVSRKFEHNVGKTVAYNHAISSLMLSEVYGMTGDANDLVDRSVIQRCLNASLEMYRWPKPRKLDHGGWRYAQKEDVDSDLSLTGWQVMFLRSARNAGFVVPAKPIDEAIGYVLNCYHPDYGTFNYYMLGKRDRRSRGMAGAGILALAHAGLHHRKEAVSAGDWILKTGFDKYNDRKKFDQPNRFNDCYHYGVFYCCQAMYQLGGRHWEAFFPKTSDVLIKNQGQNGSWAACNSTGRPFGKCYSSSLCILALSSPNQLLPIFHR